MGFKNVYSILISNRVNFRLISEFSDKEGRYVLVKGFLDQQEVTLVNVYIPPDQDNSCIREIFQLIASEPSGVLICGGDWNTQMQPRLDSSYTLKKLTPRTRVTKKTVDGAGFGLCMEGSPSNRQTIYIIFCEPSCILKNWLFFCS